MNSQPDPIRVLVTGASGYVGGRLVPALLDRGCEVRCLARTPAKLSEASWRARVEVVQGGVGDERDGVFDDIDVAVYLVHSIGQGRAWVEDEQRDARQFALHAKAAGVRRIVYLGGLGREDDALSVHLSNRHKVGEILKESGADVVELRAGVIIGSGSASFEMLRYLVEVLPIMVTPRWVTTRCQPISISDVVALLVSAVTLEEPVKGIYEIGGPDVVSYAEMMALYAQVAGLPRRRLIAVPFLTPGLSSHWVGLVTPVPATLARELVESLVNEVVVDDLAFEVTFGVHPIGLRESVARALAATEENRVPTSFNDADLVHFAPTPTDPQWSGGTVMKDVRIERTAAGSPEVYAAVTSIGGAKGWYSGDLLWRVRGILDQLVGGPGLRRGRKETLAVGDPLDFWRIEDLVESRRLRLRAEMRLPGEAWLTWDIESRDGMTEITQTAVFRPRGLTGRLYWYGIAPFHRFVFPGMLQGIVRDAERTFGLRGGGAAE